MTTSWHMRNAQDELDRRRAKADITPKQATRSRMSPEIAEALRRFRETGEYEPVIVQQGKPHTEEELIAMFEIPRLDDLSTAGMTLQQEADLLHLLRRIREWRTTVADDNRYGMIVSSRELGVGKTHIAKAVAWTFASFLYPEDYSFDPVVEHKAILLTDDDLMTILGKRDWRNEVMGNRQLLTGVVRGLRSVKCIVIDDLGRRRTIPYIKGNEEQQAREVRARFFQFVNWAYEESVHLFITTNLTIDELKDELDDATWNRLQEMCPVNKGFVQTLGGLTSYRSKVGGWL